MNRLRKAKRDKQMPSSSAASPRSLLVLMVILILASFAVSYWWNSQRNDAQPVVTPAAEVPSTATPSDSASPNTASPNTAGSGTQLAATGDATVVTPAGPDAPAGAGPTAVATQATFVKLKGRWQRPDGGYVLEIRDVASGGKMDAAYFNPQPIRVARAEATGDATSTKVFVELQAPNYPGSTYNLVYDAPNDRLVGVYFQATLQQQYEVVFERMRP